MYHIGLFLGIIFCSINNMACYNPFNDVMIQNLDKCFHHKKMSSCQTHLALNQVTIHVMI